MPAAQPDQIVGTQWSDSAAAETTEGSVFVDAIDGTPARKQTDVNTQTHEPYAFGVQLCESFPGGNEVRVSIGNLKQAADRLPPV